MKKPEKKKGYVFDVIPHGESDISTGFDTGYNQACDNWEEYLRELNKDKKESLIDISENKEDEPDNNINSYEHEEHCGDS